MRGDYRDLLTIWNSEPITDAVKSVLWADGRYQILKGSVAAEFKVIDEQGLVWGRWLTNPNGNPSDWQAMHLSISDVRPAETMLQANRERLDDLRPAKSCETCRFGLRGATGPFCTNPLVVGHGQAGYVRGVDAVDPWPSAVELCGKVEKFWWRPVRPWWMRWKDWF